ncbi:MAG: GIY-YIG nuclease family protein, partial [Sphingobacteriia bacterium]|nr:GIY-YIG nuclease family protein [Candidatus Fonsibacter lacus]
MSVERKLIIKGVIFNSILEAAMHFKVHESTLARRLRYGWTNEQAVGLEEKPKRVGSAEKVIYKGITYLNLKHLAEAFGKNAEMLRRKIRDGQTVDEALTKGVEKRISANAKAIEFNGKSYPSIQTLIDEHNVKASVYSRRIKRGWTIEQALEVEDAPPRFRNFEGHARDTKWKNERSTPTGVEPVPDAEGYKLYLILNAKSPKQYVGITIGSLQARLKQHFSATRRGRKSALQNAIKFYGEENFTIELISNNARSFEELQELEINEIIKRDCIRNGYNTAYGGSLGTSKKITVDGRIFP